MTMSKQQDMRFPVTLIQCSNLERVDLDTLFQNSLIYGDWLEVVLVVPENHPRKVLPINSQIKIAYDQHAGIYEAMNLGLQIATQEFVIFVNDDDILVKNFAEVLGRTFFDASQKLDLIEFKTQFIGEEFMRFEEFKDFRALKRGQMPTSHQGQLWRRQKLIELGGFKTKLVGSMPITLRIAADLEVYLAAMDSGIDKKQQDEILTLTSHGGYSELNIDRRYLEVAAILSQRRIIPLVFFVKFWIEFRILNFFRRLFILGKD